jgi:hypothetical protein
MTLLNSIRDLLSRATWYSAPILAWPKELIAYIIQQMVVIAFPAVPPCASFQGFSLTGVLQTRCETIPNRHDSRRQRRTLPRFGLLPRSRLRIPSFKAIQLIQRALLVDRPRR